MKFSHILIIIGIVVIVLLISSIIFPTILLYIVFILDKTKILATVGIIINTISPTIHTIIPVQPVTAKIIGYSVTICHTNPTRQSSECTTSRATTVGNNSFTLHVGDQFALEALIYNPNWFSIDSFSTSTTFDKNVVVHHYSSCGTGAEEGYGNNSFKSTEIMVSESCGDYTANSTGKTNAIIQIQYQIDKKTYSVNASKTFTILPKT